MKKQVPYVPESYYDACWGSWQDLLGIENDRFDRLNRDPQGKKKQLLELPIGLPKPLCAGTNKSPLGSALNGFTNPKSPSYDKEFDTVIRLRQPQWFLVGKAKSEFGRKQVLDLPVGTPRPKVGTPLGNSLNNGMKQCSVFAKLVREKHTAWWPAPKSVLIKFDRVAAKKKILLEIPIGEPCPRGQLRSALTRYTTKGRNSYDEAFDFEIRKLHPEWFILQSERASMKKKKIIQYLESVIHTCLSIMSCTIP